MHYTNGRRTLNAQRSTLNAQWTKLALLLVTCHLSLVTSSAWAQNVNVSNSAAHPVPVYFPSPAPSPAASPPLPVGAATSAKQDTGNTSLGTVVTNTGNIPVKGAAAPTGALPVVQATATTVKSLAKEASHVLKASAGSLVSVGGSSDTDQWILIMDSATVPANGAVTLLYPPIHVLAGSNFQLNFTTPLTAANGIAVCNSNANSFTKTVGGSDCIFAAQVQ